MGLEGVSLNRFAAQRVNLAPEVKSPQCCGNNGSHSRQAEQNQGSETSSADVDVYPAAWVADDNRSFREAQG